MWRQNYRLITEFRHVGEQVFRFKQFSVNQCGCAMKVGTDGVLLGSWANLRATDRVLDVGTGTGLISLMIAQREPNCWVDAIELDKDCAERALQNFEQSKWSSRLRLIKANFISFDFQKAYDLILSNPPYFSNSNPSPVASRAQARHMRSLPLDVLLSKSSSMLSDEGRICLILPFQELERVKELARLNSLYLTRLTTVKGTSRSASKRILIEFCKQPVTYTESNLIIELSRHVYTQDYINLTKDFYLAM